MPRFIICRLEGNLKIFLIHAYFVVLSIWGGDTTHYIDKKTQFPMLGSISFGKEEF